MNKNIKVKKIFDGVYEVPTYLDYNDEACLAFVNSRYDGWKPFGCTAVAKVIDGKTIIGRNMDLYYSKKAAYVLRTNKKGAYKTLAVCYYNLLGDDIDIIEKNGFITSDIYNVLPYMCLDVLNEKGFYIEVNMRTTEYNEDGTNKYGCDGTNKNSKVRVCATALTRYLADRCASVKEAIELCKSIDIYTPKSDSLSWNLCFLVADASGDYGVIELARNQVYFSKVNCQANFFIDKDLRKDELYLAGLGRYEYITRMYDSIKNEESMYSVINGISYSNVYKRVHDFDIRYEFVGVKSHWTTNYILDDKNFEEINAYIEKCYKDYSEGLKNNTLNITGNFWLSALTTITNCNELTMNVRFFEDENKIKAFTLK